MVVEGERGRLHEAVQAVLRSLAHTAAPGSAASSQANPGPLSTVAAHMFTLGFQNDLIPSLSSPCVYTM